MLEAESADEAKRDPPRIVGLELCSSAVADAIRNAKKNGLTIEYVVGKAEDTLPDVLDTFHGGKVLAICDPPRAGLPGKMWKTLRKCRYLDNLIYVSCNAETLVADVAKLIDKTLVETHGFPFKIEKVIGVDMFPHTEHFETVMYLRRMTEAEFNE